MGERVLRYRTVEKGSKAKANQARATTAEEKGTWHGSAPVRHGNRRQKEKDSGARANGLPEKGTQKEPMK